MFAKRLLAVVTSTSKVAFQQQRNTWVLRRKEKPYLKRSWVNPLIVGPALKTNNPDYVLREWEDYVYEVVEQTDDKKEEDIQVLLLKHVKGVGIAGDIVKVERDYFRNDLLLNHKATYASKQNLELYRELIENKEKDASGPSSALSPFTVEKLSQTYVVLNMSQTDPWTIEKRHVRVALRCLGFIVDENTIELPEEPICGPDVENKQNKDFAVFVTINNNERVAVRCVVHHCGVFVPDNWKTKGARIPILAQQKELLQSMFAYPQEEQEDDYF